VSLRRSLGYRNTVLTLGKPPSEGAKSTEYRKSQGDVARAIYDGRRGPDGKISTIAPPIQIFHPIFDDFTRFVNCPDDQPTVKDLKSVHDLMSYASVVRQSEDRYGEGLRHRLGHILDAPVHEDRNPDNTKPDGVIKVKLGDIHVPYVFLELKREIGEGGCDPTSQVSLSMRRSWIHASVGYNRNYLEPMCDS
jgi:hypothetical protein